MGSSVRVLMISYPVILACSINESPFSILYKEGNTKYAYGFINIG
jgi:hypothetical protein